MAGSFEVGRASVRVLPDTTGFRSTLQRALRKATAGVTGSVTASADLRENLAGEMAAAVAKAKAVARDIHAELELDSSGFIREARRAISTAQRSLQDLKVDVDLDPDGLVQKVKALAEEAERKADDIVFNPEIDKTKALAEMKALMAQLEAAAKDVEVDVSIDQSELSKLRRGIEGLREGYDDIEKSIDHVNEKNRRHSRALDDLKLKTQDLASAINSGFRNKDIDLKTRGALSNLAALQSRIDDFTSRVESKEIDLNTRKAKVEAAVLRKELSAELNNIRVDVDLPASQKAKLRAEVLALRAALGRQKIEFIFNADTTRIRNAILGIQMALTAATVQASALGTKLWGSLVPALTQVAMTAGVASVALVGIGGAIPAITAATVSLGSALATATTAAVGLAAAFAAPSIVALGGIFSALKISLSGVGSAIVDAEADLSGLSSSAQSAVLQIRNLKDSFDALAIQESLFSQISSFDQLASVIPPLQAALQSVAETLGRGADRLISFIANGSGLEAVTAMFQIMQPITQRIVDSIANVVEGFVALGGAAAPVIQTLIKHTESFAQVWRDKMIDGFEDGTLTEKIQVWVQQLRGFVVSVGEIFSPIVGIIRGVFGAAFNAANGPGEGLISVLNRISGAINSLAGQQAFTEWFRSMQAALGAVTPVLLDLFNILASKITPAVAGFIQSIAPGVQAFLEQLAPALQPLLDQLPELGEALGKIIAQIDMTAIIEFVSGLISGLQTITPLLAMLAPHFDEIALALGAAIVVVQGFAAALKTWSFITQVISLIKLIGPALGLLTGPIGIAVAAIAALAAGLIYAYKHSETFRNIVNASVKAVKDFFAGLPEFFSNTWDTIKNIWNVSVDFIKSLVVRWVADQVARFNELKAKISAAASAIWNFVKAKFSEGIAAVIGFIFNFVTSSINRFNTLRSTVSSIVSDLKNRVVNFFSALVSIVSSNVSRFVNDIINKFNVIKSRVTATVSGLVSGVTNFFGRLPGEVGNRVSRMRDAVVGRFNEIKNIASNFGREFVSRIVNGIGNLYDSGRSILNSFLAGITAGFNNVKNKVANSLQEVRNFFPFSPAKKGPFSGHGWVLYSGLSIGPAMAEGIKRGMSAAVNAADRLTSETSGALESSLKTDAFETWGDKITNVFGVVSDGARSVSKALDVTTKPRAITLAGVTGSVGAEVSRFVSGTNSPATTASAGSETVINYNAPLYSYDPTEVARSVTQAQKIARIRKGF